MSLKTDTGTRAKWKREQLQVIKDLRDAGIAPKDLGKHFRESYKKDSYFGSVTDEAIRVAWKTYRNILLLEEDKNQSELDLLKGKVAQAYQNSKLAQTNRLLTNEALDNAQLLEAFQEAVKGQYKPLKVEPLKVDKKKNRVSAILNLSDIHYGKLVYSYSPNNTREISFNNEICIARMKEVTRATIHKIQRMQQHYTVEKIHVFLLGDIIENALMHGRESFLGSEFTNTRQITEAINSLYFDVVVPLAQLGIPLQFDCVTGNHDRQTEKKVMNQVGLDNNTWIIYNMLMTLANAQKINAKWNIAVDSFLISRIYGQNFLLEHYDNAKANSEPALMALMRRRENQINGKIQFMRGGHFHSFLQIGLGQIITNLSVCGQDDYAKNLGFASVAGQVLEFVIDTKERSIYLETFIIQLDHIK